MTVSAVLLVLSLPMVVFWIAVAVLNGVLDEPDLRVPASIVLVAASVSVSLVIALVVLAATTPRP